MRRGAGCGRPGDDNPGILRESRRSQDASANGARFGEGLPPGSIAESEASAVNVIVNRGGRGGIGKGADFARESVARIAVIDGAQLRDETRTGRKANQKERVSGRARVGGFRDLNDFQVAALGAEIVGLRDVGDSRELSRCKIGEDVSHNRDEMKIETREERAGA